ncbi:putative protein kinase RLK-Pelle-CrRLK1L-1 family [Helianthus annuus]|nr:putative protein kinase RLK-Pelle-CrRLK1L-1 family [Helianthus annuus]
MFFSFSTTGRAYKPFHSLTDFHLYISLFSVSKKKKKKKKKPPFSRCNSETPKSLMSSLRISLEDILKATNNFAEENLLKRSGKADVYKGLLLRSVVEIDVVIRKYRSSTDITFEFYKDTENISCVKHKNVVSLIGFCDEEDERMIVMEYVVNESLDKYLSDPTTLWSERLYMCFRAACGLCYWKAENCESYYAKNFKVLLNKDKEPKLLICIDSLSDAKISKSFTFGEFLFEVLYGKKATTKDANQYLNDYEEGGLSGSSGIEDTYLNTESLSILSRIINKCFWNVEFYRIQILERLNEAFKIQWKHENPFRVEKLAYLKIPLSHIKLATDNFADKNCTSWLYRRVYKTELNHFDREGLWAIEGENKGQLPKRRIIINRLYELEKTPKDFFAEIEMLSSCKHPNVASLLGFCDEDSEMILVFECGFKETIDDYLGSTSTRKTLFNLTWEQRIRICLDIAHGLEYLQNMEGKSSVIYHGIISANVFLDEKWTAKMATIRLLKTTSYRQPGQRLVVDHIYLLGQFLFEILTGRSYKVDNLASWAPDRRMMEETHECSLKTGLDQYSLNVFFEIAYQCLEEIPSKRPALEAVINSLKSALHFQVRDLDYLKIALEDIQVATNNFEEKYCVGSGEYGKVYECSLAIKLKRTYKLGEKANSTVTIKRIFSREGFLAEFDVVCRREHPNIVSLLGFCDEDNEMLLFFFLNGRQKILLIVARCYKPKYNVYHQTKQTKNFTSNHSI